jgi:hypothetical protein
MIEGIQILISLAIAAWFAMWAIVAPLCIGFVMYDAIRSLRNKGKVDCQQMVILILCPLALWTILVEILPGLYRFITT